MTGVLLIAADRPLDQGRTISTRDAFTIGLAQAFAILPGISRSGATISCSVLLGVRRQEAAEFSFLMVVPLILGKIAKDLFDGALHLSSDQLGILASRIHRRFRERPTGMPMDDQSRSKFQAKVFCILLLRSWINGYHLSLRINRRLNENATSQHRSDFLQS